MNAVATEERLEQKTIARESAVTTVDRLEQKNIARECAADFAGMVEWYRKHCRTNAEDAFSKATGNPQEDLERVLRSPLDQIHWHEIDNIATIDAEKALELWASIKREALEELQSGHRAAKTMEATQSHPWQRAQFLAIRQELGEEWRPRNGMERQLIDTMALAQANYLLWLTKLNCWTSLESYSEKKLADEGQWTPPRVSDSEAIERAAAMMDRFNKIFLRSLRALRDLRRYSRPVIVQHAGQVNVGGQHLNVAGASIEKEAASGTIHNVLVG
ncbi:MAG: hypothetical protein EXS16_10055 [Gemmataceae bacterium]|nr:hypothetical protein [Gemmataceae bacterium]